MNPLERRLTTGTIGELLVQMRLFQYGVQAAPPLKDSGNDLIAVRGSVFKSIQVKTTAQGNGTWQIPRDRLYHILALVRLHGHDNELFLDQSEIYLLGRDIIDQGTYNLNDLRDYCISKTIVDKLFAPE